MNYENLKTVEGMSFNVDKCKGFTFKHFCSVLQGKGYKKFHDFSEKQLIKLYFDVTGIKVEEKPKSNTKNK